MNFPPIDAPPPGRDPRPRPSDEETAVDSGGHLRPAVASSRPLGGYGLIGSGAILLGLAAFVFLSSHRTEPAATTQRPSGIETGTILPPPPPPSDLAVVEAAGRARVAAAPAQAILITPPSIITAPALPVGSVSVVRTPAFSIDSEALARHSPALVIDLGDAATAGARGATQGQAAGATTGGARPATPGGSAPPALSGEEQFAQRVGGAEPERSRATLLGNAKATIPQGAVIPGVLETALDSDLPGFARAVVSRDVRSFDGSTVLIPRGSRLIGQYKSAIAQGQSRVFVIWTRVIRPDGATIQIGSPVTDPLGRAGLEGKVDRHFFERFGGSILLSVLNAGVTSLSRAPSTQVVIGSSTEATSVGAQALLPQSISPTIKVAQGSAIRIFVARDLDFSPVQGGQ